jgi:hypothetical protein
MKSTIELRQIGKVVVSRQLFEEETEAMKALFARFLPCRCEYLYASDQFEYVGYSEQLSPVADGVEPPVYAAMFSAETHRTTEFDGFKRVIE